MSATKPPQTPANSGDRVFVKIPKAGPGQHYRAPKTLAMPLVDTFTRLFVLGACASLPIVPLVIIVMIVAETYSTEPYLLWLWITMAIITTAIALAVSIGIAREVFGYTRPRDFEGAAR